MSALQNLITTRDQLAANIAAEAANPKVSYSIDGESVDWTTWARVQQDRIVQLNQTIQAMQPFVLSTRQSL